MTCKSYQQLTPLEASTYIGKLVHIFQSDEAYFKKGNDIINMAEKKGIFQGVVINPINEPLKKEE